MAGSPPSPARLTSHLSLHLPPVGSSFPTVKPTQPPNHASFPNLNSHFLLARSYHHVYFTSAHPCVQNQLKSSFLHEACLDAPTRQSSVRPPCFCLDSCRHTGCAASQLPTLCPHHSAGAGAGDFTESTWHRADCLIKLNTSLQL